jgi:uncharacterized HAD superfamily protein
LEGEEVIPTYDIILDWDDVIYPFCHGVTDVMRMHGHAGTITRWQCHEDFDMEAEPFWNLVYSEPWVLFGQRIEGEVIRSLNRLDHAGHRLHLVTARERDDAQTYCWAQIQDYDLPFTSVTFTKDKGPMVTELNASFSLDDGPHNFHALDQRNHVAFLMDAPHNRDTYTEKRVVSVKQFADIVIGFQEAGVKLRGDKW